MILKCVMVLLVSTGIALAQSPNSVWTAGKHYQVLEAPQSTDVPQGKIEVIEFFWYGCPHCYSLEAPLRRWLDRKGSYIEFKRVHVAWRMQRPHARLYYALEKLGRRDLHDKVFEAIHVHNNLLLAENNEERTVQMQAAFAVSQGISKEAFLTALRSADVQSQVEAAHQIAVKYKITSVPLIVVNGKFSTEAGLAGSHQNVLAVVDELARREHAQLAVLPLKAGSGSVTP